MCAIFGFLGGAIPNWALTRGWAACAAAGKPVGVHAAQGAVARRYRDAGCTLVTVTSDDAALVRDTAAQVRQARAATGSDAAR